VGIRATVALFWSLACESALALQARAELHQAQQNAPDARSSASNQPDSEMGGCLGRGGKAVRPFVKVAGEKEVLSRTVSDQSVIPQPCKI
jgi:hypothetical protein